MDKLFLSYLRGLIPMDFSMVGGLMMKDLMLVTIASLLLIYLLNAKHKYDQNNLHGKRRENDK